MIFVLVNDDARAGDQKPPAHRFARAPSCLRRRLRHFGCRARGRVRASALCSLLRRRFRGRLGRRSTGGSRARISRRCGLARRSGCRLVGGRRRRCRVGGVAAEFRRQPGDQRQHQAGEQDDDDWPTAASGGSTGTSLRCVRAVGWGSGCPVTGSMTGFSLNSSCWFIALILS